MARRLIGIDVVDVDRLRCGLEMTPALEVRLFTEAERAYCRSGSDPATHFAGTLAAKEAVIKVLGAGPLAGWAQRIEILRDKSGAPIAHVTQGAEVEVVPISIAHDGGVAVAVALNPRGFGASSEIT